MSSPNAIAEIHYPDSDGEPMAESDLHRYWMMRIIDLLTHRYQREQVYVSGNLMLYYVEGDPRRSISPDALVVKGISPEWRKTYKVWAEGKSPDVVFETTSESTRRNDLEVKPAIYESLGIGEYFLYDPTADYLDPPVCGFRLTPEGYVPIERDAAGRLKCESLGLWLELNGRELVLRDVRTRKVLETAAEAERNAKVRERAAKERERAAKESERAEKEAERAAKEEEHRARVAAEEEVRVLKAQLAKLGIPPETS